ncbi:DUF84 family protein [Sutcliffiella rhizosphaerae]|uniref:Probable inosine/xanthosine triphosphatase n=1 Tax=Sutcliffiella rhizosphaerae TaxID=2880967 RepID=A0ABN8AGF0_9BACI|nr:DUF84 family protein [Sutcliffiella rhizosphaerae]CAG9622133.1 Inosine/xanthosine triphosphatase [Sutcliffiella rhizosphaerae]
MKVVIGSNNPAKYNAIEQALVGLSIEASTVRVDVDSGVSNQPLSDDETVRGALQRARNALYECDEAVFAIGLEGGVVIDDTATHNVMVCNWGALVDKEGNEFIAGGARIPLPEAFRGPLSKGIELGELMEEYCQRKDIRKHEGAVGIFSGGAITRTQMFEHVCRLLVGQWIHKNKQAL